MPILQALSVPIVVYWCCPTANIALHPYGRLYRIRAEALVQFAHEAPRWATQGRYQADMLDRGGSAGLLVLQNSVLLVMPEETPQLLQGTSLDLAHAFPTDL
jgi:hypothetical protein